MKPDQLRLIQTLSLLLYPTKNICYIALQDISKKYNKGLPKEFQKSSEKISFELRQIGLSERRKHRKGTLVIVYPEWFRGV